MSIFPAVKQLNIFCFIHSLSWPLLHVMQHTTNEDPQLAPAPRRRRLVYSPKAAAIELDVSLGTMWRLVGQGKIPTVCVSLRRRGITGEVIARIAAEGIEK